jgi:hypothetical protein
MLLDTLANNPVIQMITLTCAVLLLAWASRHREQRVRRTRPQSTMPSTPAPTSTAPLAPATWLALVNDRPDEIAHLAIFGPSGSGKTSLCQGILTARGGQVVVIDPKPPRPGQTKWGGLPYLRIDSDGTYRTIDKALRLLRREVNVRLAALDAGVESSLLTIVLDEYKTLVRECPESAPDLLLRISDIGRELGIRLIILSQSRGVVALGVKGQGDTRENFVTIAIDRQHRALLEWDESEYRLDTATVVAQATSPLSLSCWWPGLTVHADRSRELRISRLTGMPDQSDLDGLAHSDAETSPMSTETRLDDESLSGGVDAEVIRTLYGAGWSKNRICTKMRGAKDRKLRIIDAALHMALPSLHER